MTVWTVALLTSMVTAYVAIGLLLNDAMVEPRFWTRIAVALFWPLIAIAFLIVVFAHLLFDLVNRDKS